MTCKHITFFVIRNFGSCVDVLGQKIIFYRISNFHTADKHDELLFY